MGRGEREGGGRGRGGGRGERGYDKFSSLEGIDSSKFRKPLIITRREG